MSLRFHAIAESYHRILNPFTEDHLLLLAEICRLHPGIKWMAVSDFLLANPHDPDAAALREWISSNRRAYLKYGRRYFSWGVFALRLVHLGNSAIGDRK